MSKNILITGCSSGLGLALTNFYLKKDYKVYGISRTKPEITNANFIHINFDLSKISEIKESLSLLIRNIKDLETVFLNAGMLGEIKTLSQLSINEINDVYSLNVYANKELLDILMSINTKNAILISSGASKTGYKGWGSYSLSKAGINMLANLYSNEMPNSKVIALAPGVIKTPMTDYIRYEIDENIFTSAKKLREGIVQTPEETAIKIDNFIKRINEFESGTYVDVRQI